MASVPGVAWAALDWGNLRDNGCVGCIGRRYSAILWGLTGDSRFWIETCKRTPGEAGTAVAGRLPTRCVWSWGNVWGEWDVPDPACPVKQHWGAVVDNGCPGTWGREHRYSSVLEDLPWGCSWERACYTMPGPAGTAVAGRQPNCCVNTGEAIWGVWWIEDAQCPYWTQVCDPDFEPGCLGAAPPYNLYPTVVACSFGVLYASCWRRMTEAGTRWCPCGNWWAVGSCPFTYWTRGCESGQPEGLIAWLEKYQCAPVQ